jgi:sugar/nucleoside kinase (ribokinase family)
LAAIAVVTHPVGATGVIDRQNVHVRAEPAGTAPIVDATGAGDAFAARLIAALVEGPWPPSRSGLQRAMAAASRLAAAVARVPGAQKRVPGEDA